MASLLVFGAIATLTGLPPARAQSPADASVFPIDPRWQVALAARPSAPPVVDRQRVFVPIEGRQVDAFALADGAALWSVAIEVAYPIAAGDGLVFVATPDGVAALEATTGAERWRAGIGATSAPPVWHTGWLVTATEAGDAVAMRAADGAVIWRQPLGAPAAAAAAIAGDRVYLPLGDGRVLALHIATGDSVWEAHLGGAGRGVAAFADRVYVGSLDNRLHCLAARDGRTLWDWRTGADVIGGAAVDAERVYFVSLDNVLYALDRRTGVSRWKTPLPTRAVGPPSMAGTTVFIPVSSRTLLFAPLRLGRPLARIELPADLFVASAFDAGRDVTVVIVTVDQGGRAELGAFGRAAPLTATPMLQIPGLAVGWPVPLVRTEWPFRYVALPAPPRRGG